MCSSDLNKQEVNAKNFKKQENDAVIMDDTTRKLVVQKWQEGKGEIITHPFLKEKVLVGLLPYVQAMLLARYLRGDINAYPPFFKR